MTLPPPPPAPLEEEQPQLSFVTLSLNTHSFVLLASLYGDGKLDENDIETMDRLRSRVLDAYSEGKINEKHYELLNEDISKLNG
jgi:hypothetical protein